MHRTILFLPLWVLLRLLTLWFYKNLMDTGQEVNFIVKNYRTYHDLNGGKGEGQGEWRNAKCARKFKSINR